MPVSAVAESRFFVGLDVGRVRDPAAIAVMELRHVFRPGPYEPARGEAGENSLRYRVRHLERMKLGTSYPAVVDRVAAIAAALRVPMVASAGAGAGASRAALEVIVDVTGVGRPIFDLLRDRRVGAVVGVNFTGGERASLAPDGVWNVPKKDLVAGLVLLFQMRELQIAEKLADAQVLVNELVNFQESLSAAGNPQFGNDGANAKHDDYVSAAALCAWRARLRAPRLRSQRPLGL